MESDSSRTHTALASNGGQWLRAMMHCPCCPSSARCAMPQCSSVRDILKHIHTSSPAQCHAGCAAGPVCGALRRLQVHYLTCEDSGCQLCGRVHSAIVTKTSSPATSSDGPTDVPSDDSDSVDMAWSDAEDSAELEQRPVGPAASDLHAVHELSRFAQYLLHSLLRSQHEELTSQDINNQAGVYLQQGKSLWRHLLRDCSRSGDFCPHPGCTPARHVLLHLIDCQDVDCELCGPTKEIFKSGTCGPVNSRTVTKAANMDHWLQEITGALQHLGI